MKASAGRERRPRKRLTCAGNNDPQAHAVAKFDCFVAGQGLCMGLILTILGIVVLVSGVLGVLRCQLLWGIIAIVVGLFLVPGYFYGL